MMQRAADAGPTPPAGPERVEHVLGEKERVARRGRIRQFVFGSLDGLLVPLGVVSGVAGGTGNVKAVIVAGIAEAFAGALSMGVGEFLSGRAEAEVQRAEIAAELAAIKGNPAYELEEMVLLLQNEGLGAEDARAIAARLSAAPQAFAKTMVEKELGLEIAPDTVRISEGLTMGISYMAASIVPLIAYFFLPIGTAFLASLGLTFLCLVGIGVVRGKLARLNLLRSAFEVVAVGTVSGLGGYFLGAWLPGLIGY